MVMTSISSTKAEIGIFYRLKGIMNNGFDS